MKKTLAFVFPGQGSQKIGMLAELSEKYAVISQTFAEASEVLGYDLWDLVQNGTQEDITLTERTQPLVAYGQCGGMAGLAARGWSTAITNGWS